jgi:Family of unknown function (DUF6262)
MMIMAHKRNVEGLLANARKKRETALVRAKEAIGELLRKKQIVNFNTVAQIAGVSTAWLYRQEALKVRIMQLREQDARRARAKRPERASETAKDAVIKTLRSRIKELDSENKALRRQIEALYGQLLESGKPSAEASVKDV